MLHGSQASTSVILVPGGWHTAFHLGPVIDSFQAIYGATLVLPFEASEYSDGLRQALSSYTSSRYAVAAHMRHSPSDHHHDSSEETHDYRILPCPLYAAGPKKERHALFEDDVEAILKLIRSEAEDHDRRVCIVAHSAAGIAALQAVDSFFATTSPNSRALVTQLICVSALCGGRNNGAQAGVEAGWITIDSTSDLMHVRQTDDFFYNDMSPAAARVFSDALVPHVMGEAATRAELMTSEAFRDIPNKTYIVCTQDAVLPPDLQKSQALEHGMDIVELAAGHCPFVSQPDAFARLINAIIHRT